MSFRQETVVDVITRPMMRFVLFVPKRPIFYRQSMANFPIAMCRRRRTLLCVPVFLILGVCLLSPFLYQYQANLVAPSPRKLPFPGNGFFFDQTKAKKSHRLSLRDHLEEIDDIELDDIGKYRNSVGEGASRFKDIMNGGDFNDRPYRERRGQREREGYVNGRKRHQATLEQYLDGFSDDNWGRREVNNQASHSDRAHEQRHQRLKPTPIPLNKAPPSAHSKPPHAATTGKPTPLLTLFTTLRSAPKKVFMYENTIKNWASLIPFVQPVLVTTYPFNNTAIIALARQHGWSIQAATRVSPYGTPYVKDLFLTILDQYDSTFYGFASGDILFTRSLRDTLQFLEKQLSVLSTTLVVGRRINCLLNVSQHVHNNDDILNLAQAVGKLFRVDAEDYFIVTKGYPWDSIPDIIIGRPGFDNFIVAFAVQSNLTVVDASQTVVALHQMLRDQQSPLDRPNVKEGYYNMETIGTSIRFKLGSTLAAGYAIERDPQSQQMYLMKRPPLE